MDRLPPWAWTAIFGGLHALAGAALAFGVVASTGLSSAPEWAYPWFLLLLPLAALVPVLQPLLTGESVLAMASADRIRARLTPRLLLAWLPGVLQVAGLILLIVALAHPRVTNREVEVTSEGLDILLVLDTSCSMETEDYGNGPTSAASRIDVAKGVVADFVEDRPHDRIGLVVFGESAVTHVPLTLDHDTLVRTLEHVDIGVVGSRGTAIGTAIAVGAKRLHATERENQVMILLTDGQDNASTVKPIEAAEAAGTLGIRIYTVGVGSGSRASLIGTLIGFDGLDEETLRSIAEATDGKYFKANSGRSLQAIYDVIDELEPTTAEVKEIVDHEEWYRRALLPGLLLLLLQAVLSQTWLRRWP